MYTKDKKMLNSFEKNIYSQFGEDGIIAEIFKRLSNHIIIDKWCVEFGAWDGIHLSNTYNLIKNFNYNAVLIEGDPKKYKLLCKNIPNNNVHKILKFVDFSGANSLDNILKSTPIPKNFDLLSIDIDGCDYHILDSLLEYTPKIICIEYNPTIPNSVFYVQPKNFNIKHGSSPASLIKLGSLKGYKLIACTTTNIFLAHVDFYHHLSSNDISIDSIRDDSNVVTYLFSGYNGEILSNREDVYLPWHQFSAPIKNMQSLPKFLLKFHSDYNLIQRLYFNFWLFFKYNSTFNKRFKNLLNIK